MREQQDVSLILNYMRITYDAMLYYYHYAAVIFRVVIALKVVDIVEVFQVRQ